ncbi:MULTISPECIES: gliding motility-associated ABC transporter substrate-binding protein GldG [unclassified Arenibacter]|uniref:gliding motility-associated ABC transporter substrate-binding protein GldG n=1 Tax=unclassified Arenibacter TaxID=2615047 RepID=UPI000E34E129|nr:MULTISPECIES: gliding motility-associated ABC transporter substrate-binding protein GldG [unclassified Arenibacter]MCM4165577.1 gliding motility-associated ABC transporter substrate-binding protein GldG [Arenibacter sp. A80]RFT54729.1 gliding motility-associated ABC transporter substrate-binding protein GldG [Arenibacter sp. P308M17]
MKKAVLSIIKAFALLLIVNVLANYFHERIDLTEDGRYTLSKAALNSVGQFNAPVIIDILLDGNLPSEFVKLKLETQQLLEEFGAENKNIKFNFVNPLEGATQIDAVITDLQALGLTPTNVTVEQNGKVSQEIIFPWAMVNYNNSTVKVPLLKNKLGATTEERVNNSVQHLEYAFADAFTKLNIKEKKKIAIIKGNGELDDIFMADYLTTIKEYYNIGAITLDSVATDPEKVSEQLNGFDLALIAKPTEAFSDEEKFILDQYIAGGGKSLWLIDQVAMELDSLFNEEGTAMALPRNLNLNDFFFKYGIRLNTDLINDLYFTQIVLATGEGNSSQYKPVPWYYHPMVFSKNDHPINNNLEAIRFQFTGSLDTLPNDYRKHVLLSSSPLSKTETVPKPIQLDIINTPPDKDFYNNGNKILGVLVEGAFKSTFMNRVKPLKLDKIVDQGPENKMIVLTDGDLIRNQVRNGRPLELGYDKWTNNFFGNKEFLINCLNYLLDDTGLINIRNKKVTIPFLDVEKINDQKTKWQLINIGLPLCLTLIFGFLIHAIRKKKYGA